MRDVKRLAAYIILTVMGTLGCDQSFEPFAESDREFSVFGHLNPGADTQWIRIMPIRSQIFTSSIPPGVSATLEETESGRSLALRDSVFLFPYVEEIGDGEGVYVYNYWTTDSIIPGRTYRFTAVGPDAAKATTATVRIPAEYAVSVALQQQSTSMRAFDELRISGVRHVAFVRVINHYRDDCPPNPQILRYAVPEGSHGHHAIPITKLYGRPGCGPNQILDKREIWIVGTEAPWPRIGVTGREWHPSHAAFGAVQMPTNLVHGIGYLGGVVIRTIPYEDCQIMGAPPLPNWCELTYDRSKGELNGTIYDGCHNQVLPGAAIQLKEVIADSITHRTIRTSRSTRQGTYILAALDPGVRYAVEIGHPAVSEGGEPVYVSYADTLSFREGESIDLSIALQRKEPC